MKVQELQAVATLHARRLGRQFMLTRPDIEDVEQEVLLVLLQRWRFFDPARGPWFGFAHRIAAQAIQVIADEFVAHRQRMVTIDDGLLENTEVGSDPEADLVAAMSIRAAIAALPPEFVLVVEAVMAANGTLADAQRGSGLSSSDFYRRLREVRYRLACLGLADVSWLGPQSSQAHTAS